MAVTTDRAVALDYRQTDETVAPGDGEDAVGFHAWDDIRAEFDEPADRTKTDDQESVRRERRRILDQMATEAEEAGLYDLTVTPERTR